ncbi:transmembrane protease serine 13a [Osmerus eperlanus]|uniref:transmembrane protease serine 13a n=1 Tax=Osmerus eperlanus TaxID=29151 RepID=UPI002E0F61A4
MAQHEENERPPPYSVAVHTQPPLKSYEDVVFGDPAWLVPPSQPYYIPQHVPAVTPLPVKEPSKELPSSTKLRCCTNKTKRYAMFGVTILFLALLGVFIWLGVHYSSRPARPPGGGHIDGLNEEGGGGLGYEGAADNDSGEDGSHGNHDKMLSISDTCSNTTVQCDSKIDCELGTDENDCVRFGENGSLHVRTSEDGLFLPVCYLGWDQSYADQTCAQLGFRSAYGTKPVSSQQSTSLTLSNKSALPIQGLVNISKTCPDDKTVSLQCVDCGRQQSTNRIIGGALSQPGQWPWQLSLQYRGTHICGGVLISPDFVITAAHCFPWSTPSALVASNWHVYGGTVSQDQLPIPYYVEQILLNENYNNKTNDRDIALLKLTAPVTFTGVVQPACLPAFDQMFHQGSNCWTTGFGTTSEGAASGSTTLMGVQVELIDSRVCNSSMIYAGTVSTNMMCAGDLKGGRDSCQGDSGGPLVCQADDSRWYLVGVTSWGAGCGQRSQPGVYTKVSSLVPWVYRKTQQERP